MFYKLYDIMCMLDTHYNKCINMLYISIFCVNLNIKLIKIEMHIFCIFLIYFNM